MSSNGTDVKKADSDDDIIEVRINPHLVGRYLSTQLNTLEGQKNAIDNLSAEYKHPLKAKGIAEIRAFASHAKYVRTRLKETLKQYGRSFGEEETPTYEDVYSYFEEQLNLLKNHETIDRLVVELANAYYQALIQEGRLKAGEWGEALFEQVKPMVANTNADTSTALSGSENVDMTPEVEPAKVIIGSKEKANTAPSSVKQQQNSATKKKAKGRQVTQKDLAASSDEDNNVADAIAQPTLNPKAMVFVPQSISPTQRKTSIIKPNPKIPAVGSSPFWQIEKRSEPKGDEQDAAIDRMFTDLGI
jgi:hypothetical protein